MFAKPWITVVVALSKERNFRSTVVLLMGWGGLIIHGPSGKKGPAFGQMPKVGGLIIRSPEGVEGGLIIQSRGYPVCTCVISP